MNVLLVIKFVADVLSDIELAAVAPTFDAKVDIVEKEIVAKFPTLQPTVDEVASVVKYAYDNKLVKIPKFKSCC